MNGKHFLFFSLLGILCLVIGWGIGIRASDKFGISPETVADYLYAVIEADRTFYTKNVVDRMEAMLVITASEKWRKEKSLPLPTQFLQEASRNLHVRNKPFRYRLISLWPISPSNGPRSETERRALEEVVKYGEVVVNEMKLGQQRYFRAIYPDRAVSRACVTCHNTHEESPKRDFNLNDVIGGLEILIPL